MNPDDEYTAYVSARLPWLTRVAFLLCQDRARADDLVQTAITRLYVRWPRVSRLENLDGYARTVLVRVFLGEQRTAWWRRVTVTRDLPETARPAGDLDQAEDLRAALAALPPRQRAAVVLRFYCDDRTAPDRAGRRAARDAAAARGRVLPLPRRRHRPGRRTGPPHGPQPARAGRRRAARRRGARRLGRGGDAAGRRGAAGALAQRLAAPVGRAGVVRLAPLGVHHDAAEVRRRPRAGLLRHDPLHRPGRRGPQPAVLPGHAGGTGAEQPLPDPPAALPDEARTGQKGVLGRVPPAEGAPRRRHADLRVREGPVGPRQPGQDPGEEDRRGALRGRPQDRREPEVLSPPRPVPLPFRLAGMPAQLSWEGAQVVWHDVPDRRRVTLTFSNGLLIKLKPAGDADLKAPNTTVEGHPAYRFTGTETYWKPYDRKAAKPENAEQIRERRSRLVGSETLCVYNVRTFDVCMYTEAQLPEDIEQEVKDIRPAPDWASEVLRPSGGLVGLFERMTLIEGPASSWSTKPFPE